MGTADDLYDAVCEAGGLTRRQLLIWAANRLAPDAPVFTETALAHIRGTLEVGVFMRAFQAVVDDADALRAVFDDVDGWPRQRFRPDVAAPLAFIDLSAERMPDDALADLVRAREAATVGGDGPLLASLLVRLAPEHHVWVLVQHQLISDAWSFALVYRRLVTHYRAVCIGDVVAPAARCQFRDYVAHERCFRASAVGRAARAYWLERRCAAAVRPPARESVVGGDATRVERVSPGLGPARTAALRRLAAAESPSIDTGLFCIFGSLALLHEADTFGLRELVLSVPFANRPSQRFKDTIGTFMNICPVRVALERGDTFLTLLRRVAAEMWDVARHQGYAVRHVAVDQPHDVLVNVHKEAVAGRDFAGMPMTVEWLPPSHRFGALAIGVQDFNAAGDLGLALDFNVAMFGPASRDDTQTRFLRLLDGVLADPARPVGFGSWGPVARKRDTGAVPRSPMPPASVLERAIAAIWGAMLGIDAVGRDDEFFALGGDSLLAYRMIVRLRLELRIVIDPETFFTRPTVAGIAAAVTSASSARTTEADVARELDALDGMSDAQATTLLAVERGSGCDHA